MAAGMQPDWLSTIDPNDELAWQAVADWLEEHGQPLRGELLRLTRVLCRDLSCPDRKTREDRQIELLAQGVEPFTLSFTNSIGMEFVWVPAGRFLMGSPEGEDGRHDDEGPVHEVEISRGFWLGRYPVTQAEYRAVMRKNPSHFCPTGDGEDEVRGLATACFPVESVSWEDAQAFCHKLSGRSDEKRQKRMYCLPSEAQWEYACRAGIFSYPCHAGAALPSGQANFDGTFASGSSGLTPFLERPCAVGSFRPNAFGLYDMYGNIWEWCADWYAEDYYARSPRLDPTGPSTGSYPVNRGGSWDDSGRNCRSAARGSGTTSSRSDEVGFRVAVVPSQG